ncbi:MAG TPA: hypothetical protein PLZ01_07035, partial [bacterium]|nr:hypothetical protein [bacterium]
MNLFRYRKVYRILLFSPIFFAASGQAHFIRPLPENLVVEKLYDTSGKELLVILVDGRPPQNLRNFPSPLAASSTNLSEVPAYDWSFGCSPTSAAMMAAYYDAHGYPNIYTGPVNGGIMPLNNSIWGSAVINDETIKLCPLSATRNGLDGRTIRGHVDDYWVAIGSTEPDPFITNGWMEHT